MYQDYLSTRRSPKLHIQKKITVTSTAYAEMGKTATGYDLRKHPNAKVIAVDPRVIPLGSKVYIPGYGTAIARDTGGAIKGKKIDVFYKSKHKCINWGRHKVKITVYKK
ncbi:3D domain-containing protein [Terrilactibacillus sp. S3-3]|nr:3D domain-containing protein [Terrilactibacillus sp. S3-3]